MFYCKSEFVNNLTNLFSATKMKKFNILNFIIIINNNLFNMSSNKIETLKGILLETLVNFTQD